MSPLKLYTYPNNKNAYKAQIAAKYGDVKLELPKFEMRQTNTTPEFKEMSPAGKVPALMTPEGGLFESNAIARYVARKADTALVGNTAYESGLIDAWIDFSTCEVDAPLMSWLLPLMHFMDFNKQRQDAAIAALKKSLGVLEAHLTHNTFLVGHRVTLADIVAGNNVYIGFSKLFDEEFRKEFPALQRWYLTLAHDSHFTAVWGKVQLCEQALKFTPKPKEGKPKEAKAAEQPKEGKKEKEASKPAPAAAPAADGDDEPKPAAKPKNPLDALPPSSMMLDGWKRLYSNTPAAQFRGVAIKGLWEGADIPRSLSNEHFDGYDPEGFSFWFCDYKYDEENTVNFIVMNKVGGFLQRLDYVRKYAFGVICILKNEQGQFPIRGVWIFRGQDIPPIMQEECVDLELYTWSKVDLSDPAQKKRAEDMIVEEDKIDGLELIEAKVFK